MPMLLITVISFPSAVGPRISTPGRPMRPAELNQEPALSPEDLTILVFYGHRKLFPTQEPFIARASPSTETRVTTITPRLLIPGRPPLRAESSEVTERTTIAERATITTRK